MELELTGKRALVTGSTGGIGLAIVEGLAREGAEVWLNGRTPARVDAAVKAVLGKVPGAKVHGVVADLGTAAGAKAVVDAAPELDILVNNVGIFEAKDFEQIPDADWEQFFQVNVMSGVRLSRHHLPGMKARNFGRILFISSESSIQIPREMIHYGMTKTAQVALARGLAELTRGTAVTVNSILPGPTRSEGVGAFVEGLAAQQKKSAAEVEKDFFRHARPHSLLERFETVEEIAALVTFVASPRSAGVNGAALRVDGGAAGVP